MKIIAFNTALPKLSLSVGEAGKPAALCELNARGTASKALFVWLKRLLEETKIDKKEISALAVTVGPGSFTGIRIGLSAAKGLAYALNLKVAPYSTLEAMALTARVREGLVFPVINAKRGMFYGALFRFKEGQLERLTEDSLLSPENVKRLEGKVIFVGEAAGELGLPYIPPVGTASAMIEFFSEERLRDLKSIKPVYLRPSDAEEKYGITIT